jgi:hypothetical protein
MGVRYAMVEITGKEARPHEYGSAHRDATQMGYTLVLSCPDSETDAIIEAFRDSK